MSRPPRILAFGDNVVDCYSDRKLMFPGGNAVNHSVFAHRAGAETFYVGKVGNDRAGHLLHQSLVDEGVDTSLMRFGPTTTAFCLIETHDGDRVFVGCHLGDSIIAPERKDLMKISECDAVHTGRSSHIDAWIPTFSKLTKVSYDLATVHEEKCIAAAAPYCFLMSFSGSNLSSSAAQELAQFAVRKGSKWVLVTRGEHSAFLVSSESVFEKKPLSINVVDTLGAGDAFIANVLVGLLIRQEHPNVVLDMAAKAAANTCQVASAFGHGVPIDIDTSQSMSLEAVYATTKAVPGPAQVQ